MIRVVTRNDWPNLDWQDLPRGSWLTVRRAPSSYLNIREKHGPSVAIPAFVGTPMPLDPKVEYQFQNVGDEAIDLFTDPAAAAPFTWTDRRSEVVVSDCPVPGGNVGFGFRVQNATPAGVTVNPIRHTTVGLRGVAVTWASDGTITFAVSAVFDPRAPAVGTNEVRVFKALGANVPRIFAFGVCGNNLDTDDNAVALPGRGSLGEGMLESIVFPVTTTPNVSCRVKGVF